MGDDFRAAFPFFTAHPGLVYLDNAATTQKPRPVVEAVRRHLEAESANPGRGSYRLAGAATRAVDAVRARTAGFIGAGDPDSVAFTSGATASLNAVVQCWGRSALRPGDEVLLSPSDHAANVAPWYRLAADAGVRLVEYRLTASGDPDIADVAAKLSPRTKVVVLTHVHNVFGELTSVAEFHRLVGPDVAICVDAAQSVGHTVVDVADLGADFLAFSAHKMFGPPGAGVLWAAPRMIDAMRPAVVGGGMAGRSGLAAVVEAGTPNTAGIVGLGAAIEFIESAGLAAISARLSVATREVVDRLSSMSHVRLLPGIAFSTACSLGFGIVSFRIDGMDAADVGFVLDDAGICVRTGGHCAHDDQLSGESVRISLHAYTTDAELDRACDAVAALGRRMLPGTHDRPVQLKH
ncbi:MAG TPA: aminotransferase class V-fold PLP-dependent enzyme [Jiangellaceae bacterium]